MLKTALFQPGCSFHVLRMIACLIYHYLNCVLSTDPIKNTVAANEDEVEAFVDRDGENFRFCDDAVRVTSILLHLGYTVSKRPRYLLKEQNDDVKNYLPIVCLGSNAQDRG